jgi:hypothetical protein
VAVPLVPAAAVTGVPTDTVVLPEGVPAPVDFTAPAEWAESDLV